MTEKLFEEIYNSCNSSENAYDTCQGSLDSNGNSHISENVKEPEKEQC